MTEPAPGTTTSRRPPRWLPRALVYAAAIAMLAVLLWHAVSAASQILLMLLCALFLALAIEPLTEWIVRHWRWRRGVATAAVMVGGILLVLGIIALFGKMFIDQLVELFDALPAAYSDVTTWAKNSFNIDLPPSDELLSRLVQAYGSSVSSTVISLGTGAVSVVVSLFGVILVVYYMVAQGPKFRGTICRPLPPERQKEVLLMWEIAQDKISGYINSRIALAALSSFFTFLFLQFVVKVPFAAPLAVFVGVVSQFVPTVGTYIAGAVPVIVGLTSTNPLNGIFILIFIIAYQQVENLYFSPKISARTMDINPAVAFVSVLVFGAVMGPIGAFLSLPLTATATAVISTYVHRYDLIESELLRDSERHKERHGESNGHTAAPQQSAADQPNADPAQPGAGPDQPPSASD